MRIAILNWSLRRVGGVETYLEQVLPLLMDKGHDLAFLHESDVPSDRDHLAVPRGVPCWSASAMGSDSALAAMRAWQPDILYTHILTDTDLEARALAMGVPSVHFAHAYHGTCISGRKAHSFPTPTPCTRRFGPACLAWYFPRRCGGLSAVTMASAYRTQLRKLALIQRHDAVVTASEHMRKEYLRHGVGPHRLFTLPYGHPGLGTYELPEPPARSAGWRLLFLGRMDALKGGDALLAAIPHLADPLRRDLCVTLAGDGPARAAWERAGRVLQQKHPDVKVEFTGWLESAARDAALASAHLLVVPSLWPEPFGRVGLEAGLWGTPAVAFNVGGISEWLQEGFNGHFAAADPSSAAGLAAAITRSLEDGAHYAALRAGAFQAATRQSAEDHATRLAAVLDKVARAGSAGSTPDPQRPRAGRDEGTGRPLTAKERVVKPARLCFVVESGTDVRLVEGLAERFELTVLARRVEGGFEVSHRPRTDVATIVGPPSRVKFAWLVGQWLRRRSAFDFVLVQGYGPAALAAHAASRITGVPTAMLVCSPAEAYYRCRSIEAHPDKRFRRHELAALHVFARLNARVGRQYIVLSHHLRDVVRGHGARGHIDVVPIYAVDTEVFKPTSEPKVRIRARLDLPTTGAHLFFSSRLAPEKDTTTLLRAAAKLIDRGRDLWLLHRSGSYRGFVAKAEEAGIGGRVIAGDALHPSRPLAEQYQAADLCVQASREEGLGFSPLEALACGVPVVAADVGGLRETIIPGETGWTYPVGNADALASCIESALDDPAEAQRRVAAGRSLVHRQYERRRAFEALEQIIEAARVSASDGKQAGAPT